MSKDANVKELETKLEALRQHSELQQDLVMNLLRPSKEDPSTTLDPEVMVNGGPELKNDIADDIVPFMVSVIYIANINSQSHLFITTSVALYLIS